MNVFIAFHRPQVELSQIEKEAAPLFEKFPVCRLWKEGDCLPVTMETCLKGSISPGCCFFLHPIGKSG